jgi:hypothetical protein
MTVTPGTPTGRAADALISPVRTVPYQNLPTFKLAAFARQLLETAQPETVSTDGWGNYAFADIANIDSPLYIVRARKRHDVWEVESWHEDAPPM